MRVVFVVGELQYGPIGLSSQRKASPPVSPYPPSFLPAPPSNPSQPPKAAPRALRLLRELLVLRILVVLVSPTVTSQ